jgi:hypothetical protein
MSAACVQEPGEEQQQPDELLAASAAAAANDTGSTSSSSNTGAPAAAQPVPAIDIAASNGSWLLPALSRAFVSLDHEFGAISEGSYVGTTAVVVLIGGSRMWVAHAGDSRAVLGRGGAVQVLTSDHKASRDDEVARVQVGYAKCAVCGEGVYVEQCRLGSLGRGGAVQVLTSDHDASRDDEVARRQVWWFELRCRVQESGCWLGAVRAVWGADKGPQIEQG